MIVEDALSPTAGGVSELVKHAGFDAQQFVRFADALRVSGRSSVDEFLEFRPDLMEVGKASIAAALIPLENERTLFPTQFRADDLYQHLFSQMRAPQASWTDNKLTVVTFNYDRSLEHYWTRAFSSAFGVTYDDAGRDIAKIPVIHVYGSLGNLPGPARSGRPYEPNAEPDRLRLAASSLMIIHESSQLSAPALQRAKEAMAQAERILFLGFGYHPTNLCRLEVRSIRQHIAVYGTSLGFTDAELAAITKLFAQKPHLDPLKTDSVMYLRTIQPLDAPR